MNSKNSFIASATQARVTLNAQMERLVKQVSTTYAVPRRSRESLLTSTDLIINVLARLAIGETAVRVRAERIEYYCVSLRVLLCKTVVYKH
ncbi:hypothetical protein MRB53_042289 [Persea americana]|nr:hypothetical protein MRB53_042289 [Persea americana]